MASHVTTKRGKTFAVSEGLATVIDSWQKALENRGLVQLTLVDGSIHGMALHPNEIAYVVSD